MSLHQRRHLVSLSLILSACFLGPNSRAQDRTPLPSLESFFGVAALQSARLSPSGRWLAAQVASKGERAKLVVMDLDNKVPSMVIATFSRADVRSFSWVNDDLLVLSVDDHTDTSGRFRYPALLSARRDGESLRLLIKRDLDTLYPPRGSQPLEANHQFLSLGEPGSDEIIVGETVFDAAFEVASVRPIVLDARTGARRSLLKKEPKATKGWIFDRLGRARVALARLSRAPCKGAVVQRVRIPPGNCRSSR